MPVPSGVIPPLVTPLHPDGRVDHASVGRLVEHLVGAGVDGLFVCGSTGEVALLDDAQRDEMVEATVTAAAGRVPVLAGAIDTGTRRVVAHARRAVAAGADAVVVTPPFYVAPHPDEIATHFRAVRDAVGAPVVAYDIPSATHVPLPLTALERLAADGTIVALKDSSGDLARFRQALDALAGSGLGMLTGNELFADLALQAGATGMVPGLGNVDPTGYVAIGRAVAAGDLATARAEQLRLLRLFRITDVPVRARVGHTAGALGAFKAALWARGVVDHPDTAAPCGPLSAAEVDRVRALLVDAGLEVVR